MLKGFLQPESYKMTLGQPARGASAAPRGRRRAAIFGLNLVLGLGALFGVASAQSTPGPSPAEPAALQVQGAGATFPSKVYARWAETYAAKGGSPVVYKPTGSGDGVQKITARQVMFGGTDSPLPLNELSKRQLLQVPTVIGGIVPVVNLPDMPANRLALDGPVLADLMAGRITRWNDPRVAALNPGVALPALAVHRVVRADKSGTTEGFTKYLAKVSPEFASGVGAGPLPTWPGEVIKGEGNDGVSRGVQGRKGAIGYVSYDRVIADGLSSVRLRNAAGRTVAPSEQGFRAAILESELSRQGDDLASLLDRPGNDSWPITLTSYVLFDANPARADAAAPVLKFLYWCFMHGDELTRGTGFAPLPLSVQSRLAARFSQVKPQDGRTPQFQSF